MRTTAKLVSAWLKDEQVVICPASMTVEGAWVNMHPDIFIVSLSDNENLSKVIHTALSVSTKSTSVRLSPELGRFFSAIMAATGAKSRKQFMENLRNVSIKQYEGENSHCAT